MATWIHAFHAKNPKGGEPWETGITVAKFRNLNDHGDMCRAFRLRLVPGVLISPDRIFHSWNRPDTEECYIYVGRPASDWRSKTIELPPPKGQSFIVCVLPDGEVDYWGWREDGENGLPQGIEGDQL